MDQAIRLGLEAAAKIRGVVIAYSRAGARLCVIHDALHSNARPEVVQAGATVHAEADAFIVLADRLTKAGQRIEPEEADQIELTSQQSTRTFQVQSPGRGRLCYQRMGTGPVAYRIYAKKISESP